MKLPLFNTYSFLYNKDNNPPSFKRINPVLVSIPVMAFKIHYIEYENPENIIETTIFKLKKIGLDKNNISKKLCLSEELIKKILDHYSDFENGKENVTKKSRESYIFYDCYSERFLDNYMSVDDFDKYTDYYITEKDDLHFKFAENISDSRFKVVYMLQNPTINTIPTIIPNPSQIIKIFQKAKDRPISDTYYANAEYLNECKYIQLVCPCYIDEDMEMMVANPIFGIRAKNIWLNIQNVLSLYPQQNQTIRNQIDSMNNHAKIIVDDISDDGENSHAVNIVLKRFGEKIKKHLEIYQRLIELEKKYIEFHNKNVKVTAIADCQSEISAFQIAVHGLLEKLFINSFYRYKSDELLFSIGRISKNNSNHELLRAYILKLGFEADDDTIYRFLNGVNLKVLEKMFASTGKPKDVSDRINLWVVANIICGAFDKTHPICEVGVRIPKLISALQTTLAMRNPAAHGSAHIYTLSAKECEEIYYFCYKTVEIMLRMPIKTIKDNEEIEEQVDIQKVARIKADDVLKKVQNLDDALFYSFDKVCVSYFKKDRTTFFFNSSNFLHALFSSIIINNNLYDDFAFDNTYNKLPDDINSLCDYVNKILELNGVKYRIKSKVGKQKIIGDISKIDKVSLAGIMVLFVLTTQEKRPVLFSTITYCTELLETTDDVIELREHNNMADFSNNGNKIDSIFNHLVKFAKEYKE